MDGLISEAGGHGLGVKPGYPRPRREQDSANDRAEMPPASCRMCLPWRAAPAADRRDISPAVGWPVPLFSSLSLRKTVSLRF